MVIKSIRVLLGLFCAAFLASCASNKTVTEAFPEPKAIEPMVVFWEQVYSKWDTNEAVFHDDLYLDVVYEVVNLSMLGLSEGDERSYLRNKKAQITAELEELARRYHSGQSLTRTQKLWATQLKKAGNERALTGISERLRYQRGLKTRFKQGLEISGAYLPYMKALFKREGVPEAIAYLPHVESSFQNHARSFVGAAGMWQFMPGTARAFMPMQKNVVDGRFDPYIAARGAAAYLKKSHQHLQSWPLAVTSYNHGLGGMISAKNQLGRNIETVVWHYQGPRFKFASRNFYAEFIAAKRIAENPHKYFPQLHYRTPSAIDGVMLHYPMRLSQLSLESGVDRGTLIRLNPAWLQGIHSDRADIPAHMEVWLPKGYGKRIPVGSARLIWPK